MALFSLEDLQDAARYVGQWVPETPAYSWPLLAERCGCEVVVKHENHTPTGAFKVRGGLVYVRDLVASGKNPEALITATRGNHGQSIPFAASKAGLRTIVYVPEGNSVEKNAAMKAFGAELHVHGADFEEARQEAGRVGEANGYEMVPPFHRSLVLGVATYGLELFSAHKDLDTVYVPIGMGTGICSLITVRDLLGLDTKIVGVVSENAPAHALSFEKGERVETDSARTFVDGIATRSPMDESLEIMLAGAERIIQISDDDVAEAMRCYFETTHNVAESAGAAPLAGLLKERDKMAGRKVGVILCGGNVDTSQFTEVLSGKTPQIP